MIPPVVRPDAVAAGVRTLRVGRASESAVSILVVEDKDSLRAALRKTLEAEGHDVVEARDGAEARALVATKRFDAVLTDLKLPKADGLAVLEATLAAAPETPVIVMTAFGSIETAVAAMKAGATDFLAKPVDPDHLLLLVERAGRARRLRRENLVLRDALADRAGAPQIVGESEAIRAVAEECRRVAKSNATALLLGDSGTGKELFARAIHHLSPRAEEPFVALNCAAIPETLLENELFGHEKGAYTGASEARPGKFELADSGTLFLDEIGDVSAGVQAKLLRVLQERTFERIGGTQTIECDVRIVAATNRDLKREVESGRFREDLYYRLSVFPVHVPALARRKEDIPLLARHFAARHAAELGRPGLELSDDAIDALVAQDWPGNVRELQNAIERAVILADDDVITAADLALAPAMAPTSTAERVRDVFDLSGSLQDAAGRAAALVEELKIRDALAETEGNKTRAAKALGVSYKTLLNKMRDLGVS